MLELGQEGANLVAGELGDALVAQTLRGEELFVPRTMLAAKAPTKNSRFAFDLRMPFIYFLGGWNRP
jgi:hypothetical protein